MLCGSAGSEIDWDCSMMWDRSGNISQIWLNEISLIHDIRKKNFIETVCCEFTFKCDDFSIQSLTTDYDSMTSHMLCFTAHDVFKVLLIHYQFKFRLNSFHHKSLSKLVALCFVPSRTYFVSSLDRLRMRNMRRLSFYDRKKKSTFGRQSRS